VRSRSKTLREGTTSRLAKPRVIIFDLDGTLVDSRADITSACNHTLRAHGRAELDEEVVARFVGDGAKKLLARAFVDASPDELERALDTFRTYYAVHAADRTRWMPGAPEVLKALAPLSLGIATNKPKDATTTLLSALGATSWFAGVVSGDDGPLKPSPEPIRAVVAKIGAAAGDAWLVGDGTQDVLAARSAGATSVAVLGGFTDERTLREARPDALIATLSDLLPLVRSSRTTS
jgi:phosphoglycolate phosphatase